MESDRIVCSGGWRRGPRSRAWPWLGALVVLVVLVMALLALPLTGILTAPAENMAARVLGRPVVMDSFRVNLFSLYPWVKVKGLQVADAPWAGHGRMVEAGRLKVVVDGPSLLRGELVFDRVEISDGVADLKRRADGKANWSGGRASGPLEIPAIRELEVGRAEIGYVDEPRKLDLKGTLRSSARGEGLPFVLEGKGELNRLPLKLYLESEVLPGRGRAYPFRAELEHGKTRVTADGTVPNLGDLTRFSTRAVVEGANMADLYYLFGLVFPTTKAYRLEGELVRAGNTFDFREFSGKVGSSDLHGHITVKVGGERPLLTADLLSKLLDPRDAGVIFGEPDPDRVLPDVPLEVARLRSMDAEVRYRADAINVSAVPLKEVDLTLDLKGGALRVDPLIMTLPQGRLKGTLVVDATKDVPDVTMDATLSGAQLQDFMKTSGAPSALEGPLLARVKLHGVGNSVHAAAGNADGQVAVVIPRGKIRQAFAELMGVNVARGLGLLLSGNQKEVALRCAVASFDARDGVLYSSSVVFDTGVVKAEGTGRVNLEDESLQMRLRGAPKEPRLLRLMLPVTVGGTLRHPKLGVDVAGAASQAGAATALGVVLTPLAAVLPFVDPGLADNADCRGLVAEARAVGVPVSASATTMSGAPAKRK